MCRFWVLRTRDDRLCQKTTWSPDSGQQHYSCDRRRRIRLVSTPGGRLGGPSRSGVATRYRRPACAIPGPVQGAGCRHAGHQGRGLADFALTSANDVVVLAVKAQKPTCSNLRGRIRPSNAVVTVSRGFCRRHRDPAGVQRWRCRNWACSADRLSRSICSKTGPRRLRWRQNTDATLLAALGTPACGSTPARTPSACRFAAR